MRKHQMVTSCAALLAVILSASPVAAQADDTEPLRNEMVQTIEWYARDLGPILRGGIAASVLEVMRQVKRHLFVPAREQWRAYSDRPLEIGYGQTISQPFIVALMTHLLEPKPDDVILEIGTGSGYQAAILSLLVSTVCTIEIVSELGETAAQRLTENGFANVRTRIADGYHGWPECGPFDGIVVTAAIDHVPPPLVRQLSPGGRIVIPLGSAYSVQALTVVEKSVDGEVHSRQLIPVKFVPFRRSR